LPNTIQSANSAAATDTKFIIVDYRSITDECFERSQDSLIARSPAVNVQNMESPPGEIPPGITPTRKFKKKLALSRIPDPNRPMRWGIFKKLALTHTPDPSGVIYYGQISLGGLSLRIRNMGLVSFWQCCKCSRTPENHKVLVSVPTQRSAYPCHCCIISPYVLTKSLFCITFTRVSHSYGLILFSYQFPVVNRARQSVEILSSKISDNFVGYIKTVCVCARKINPFNSEEIIFKRNNEVGQRAGHPWQ